MAIDSGYYYTYGGDHDTGWLRQTKAHNDILVGGQGQPIFDLNAEGRIATFVHGDQFDYVVGDAAAAYAGRLERFDRHILFVRPDYFVIFDSLRAPQPTTFTWMLHALERMRVDEAKRQVAIDRNDAHLLVQFAEPSVLRLVQTDQFDVPTTDPRRYPNQWHLQAATVDESRDGYFLTALIPYRTQDAGRLPVVKSLAIAGRHAMEIAWPDGRRDLVRLRRHAGRGEPVPPRADGYGRTRSLHSPGSRAAPSRRSSATGNVSLARLKQGGRRRRRLVESDFDVFLGVAPAWGKPDRTLGERPQVSVGRGCTVQPGSAEHTVSPFQPLRDLVRPLAIDGERRARGGPVNGRLSVHSGYFPQSIQQHLGQLPFSRPPSSSSPCLACKAPSRPAMPCRFSVPASYRSGRD